MLPSPPGLLLARSLPAFRPPLAALLMATSSITWVLTPCPAWSPLTPSRQGRFPVLEGIGRCGKSTQLELFRQWLAASVGGACSPAGRGC